MNWAHIYATTHRHKTANDVKIKHIFIVLVHFVLPTKSVFEHEKKTCHTQHTFTLNIFHCQVIIQTMDQTQDMNIYRLA